MREEWSHHSDWKRKNMNGERNFALSTSQKVKKKKRSFFENVQILAKVWKLGGSK